MRPRPCSGRRPRATPPPTAARPSLAAPARRQNRNLWFWVFVGPFVIGLIVFVYVPIAWSVYLSFFEARNTSPRPKFVGFGNYTTC